MNKQRREVLRKCIQELQNGGEFLKLERVRATVESILAEESDSMENTPESLQGTDRYLDSEEAVDNMENAIEHLESAFQDDNGCEAIVKEDIKTAIEYLSNIL